MLNLNNYLFKNAKICKNSYQILRYPSIMRILYILMENQYIFKTVILIKIIIINNDLKMNNKNLL